MQIYYLIPLVLIAAGFAYSMYVRKKVMAEAANMTPEQIEQRFSDLYAPHYELQPGERIIGNWSGVEYQAPTGTARRVAGGVLNAASAAVIGVSTYVPNVHVGLTNTGRVLVSREYSDFGKRGNYRHHAALDQGTRAFNQDATYPGQDIGSRPGNPFNPLVSLEFIQLRSPSGDIYEAWLSPQGSRHGQHGFCSILQSLG
ncbi:MULTISPECIES: hypothetical protein [Sorangium]|uniref:Uncharacterized protein n=1 Tax=Sorangium cellulosum TaxID=56 RepID=A0A4P2QKR8_SORCE|nr:MULTISPECIES: hypothetical protein [Sorangium]AUX30594.1 hypothetical protein SOCE836_027030 [Sorangium cellulosum]WCQ89988.1 hypothetical protein NQZ70_02687 [Sorangium sp. Soce836]